MSENPNAKGPEVVGRSARAFTKVGTPGDLGRAIRVARRRLKLTQEELATHLGVSRPYLSELEGGKETVHVRRLLDTLGALGVDLYLAPRSSGQGDKP